MLGQDLQLIVAQMLRVG